MKIFLLRWLTGPASIADGVVETLTFGLVSPKIKLKTATVLARARMNP